MNNSFNKLKRLIKFNTIFLAIFSSASFAATLEIPVLFDDMGGGKFCPSPRNDEVSVGVKVKHKGKANQKVVFRGSPAGHAYSLSFDPFSGKLYKSNRDGVISNYKIKLSSGSIPTKAESDPNQKNFSFKYSIYAKDCPTIDPIIIIERWVNI